ncbi:MULTISPECIES: thioredoxin family protein [unclassified Streptomyces]|uniref:thioredoxin family protein n=1 Tax=unclassified Streptomyces TaxID=2593676 RepID=UPI001CB72002|nr:MULTISPECIES: thioredoxin family protein [unclassified Streptomyces]MBD0710680.1 thiol reductase thioredoxin [Streptomyces sp. CBMA291]MBD0715527.1 thiol reductase thioredoxin [Streptomyces sp. CBMA370]
MTTGTTTGTTEDTAATAAGGVLQLTDADFDAVVRESGLPVLVEFTADWCGPCRQMKPVLRAVAAEEADRLRVAEIDLDHNPETALRYGVLSAPTMLLFRAGEPVRSLVGSRAKRRLLEDLADALD